MGCIEEASGAHLPVEFEAVQRIEPDEQASVLQAREAVEALNRFEEIAVNDLPPLLSTDGYLGLAEQIDSMLLTVSEGSTRREDLLHAREYLNEAALIGRVLNRPGNAALHNSYYCQ